MFQYSCKNLNKNVGIGQANAYYPLDVSGNIRINAAMMIKNKLLTLYDVGQADDPQSAINFYGGTGESAHKLFVKAPGLKTQRRVSEFAVQTARQYYDMLVTSRALQSIEENESTMTVTNNNILYGEMNNDDNVSVGLSGRYSIPLTDDIIEDMRNENNRRRSSKLSPCFNKKLKNVKFFS